MNAEELTEKFGMISNANRNGQMDLSNVTGKNTILIQIFALETWELVAQAKIDFFGINCYRSNVAKESPADSQRQEIGLNKSGKKEKFAYPNYPGIFCSNSESICRETTDWDWEIDPVAMRYLLRYMEDHCIICR